MKQKLYYGNLTANNIANLPNIGTYEVYSDYINFTGMDLSEDQVSVNKLDLLFYNRVNEIGEVLSSLVYISGPLSTSDISYKTYDVTKLYANTTSELSMHISSAITDFTYLNTLWQSGKYFVGSISPMADTQHELLVANGTTAVRIEKYGISFDGWYTQMSLGIRMETDLYTPSKGIIALHTFSNLGTMPAILLYDNPADLALDSNWQYLYPSILPTTVSMADILNSSSSNIVYVKHDIFILPNYLELYDKAVVQYAEYPTYGNPFSMLRNKHRIIHNYCKDIEFIEAQYILQTTEYFRSVINN